MKIYYVTSNKGKFDTAVKALSGVRIELLQKKLDTPEIQSLDGRKIAAYSAKYASRLLQKPVIKNDTFWSINCLNGFPGPFMAYIKKWLTYKDILKLIEGKDRNASITQYLAYCEPKNEPVVFQSTIKGILAEKPEGENQTLIDNLFIPEGLGKPMAAIDKKDYIEYWAKKETYWKDFVNYLILEKKVK